MKCCERCFNDADIKLRIKNLNEIGKCDICDSEGVYTLDITKATQDSNYAVNIITDLEDILDLYSLPTESQPSFSLELFTQRSIYDHLKEDWNIFNLKMPKLEKLLNLLLAEYKIKNQEIFSKLVVPQFSYNQRLIMDKSIHLGKEWADFEKEIKYQNRFHAKLIQTSALKEYLKILISPHTQ